MPQRLRYGKAFPEGLHALMNLGKVIHDSGLEPSLQELVKTRASQMNGCAYCIDMHTKDARAALAWTEAITNIQQGHAPDELYEAVRK